MRHPCSYRLLCPWRLSSVAKPMKAAICVIFISRTGCSHFLTLVYSILHHLPDYTHNNSCYIVIFSLLFYTSVNIHSSIPTYLLLLHSPLPAQVRRCSTSLSLHPAARFIMPSKTDSRGGYRGGPHGRSKAKPAHETSASSSSKRGVRGRRHRPRGSKASTSSSNSPSSGARLSARSAATAPNSVEHKIFVGGLNYTTTSGM